MKVIQVFCITFATLSATALGEREEQLYHDDPRIKVCYLY
jgi:hypothetical protein